jgi:enamine deaminase RidA (YjgF/YER057c/UK114 family)
VDAVDGAVESADGGYNPSHLVFPGMSQAVRCGPFVQVSGQVALGLGGEIVSDDPYEQALQCFENLELSLAAAGSSLTEVTKLVTYLVDVTHYEAYARAKHARFTGSPPASTTIVVATLLDPRMLLEVEAWAYTGG